MKQYMLVYKGGDPDWMEHTSQEEMGATMAKWGEWMETLKAKDQLISGGSPLYYTGKTINKEGVVTDMNTSEIKELVTGYSIIAANNEAEAIAIAKTSPIFLHPNCSLDLREIVQMG